MGRSVGPYELVRELGRGGMGVVHEARHPAWPRRLALKLLLRDALPDADTLARFRREAELLARVQHPNVVRVHALDVAPEGPYLVTDLVEGRTLSAVAREAPLGFEAAARLVRALCDAVAALHGAGVLHRDLKPQNVMVQPDGEPVLLDFGLARDLTGKERLTVTGALLGTPAYMAPEQAEGASPASLGPTVDVYALGAVLLHALTGLPPFEEGASPMVTIKRVLFDEPRWPSTVRRGVPEALDAICRHAMARSAGDRYPTAAALRDDLDRFLRGERPVALANAPRRRGRRAAWIAGAVVLAALGVVGGALAARGAAPPPPITSEAPPSTTTTRPPPPSTERARPRGPREALPVERSVARASIDGGLALPHPAPAWVVYGEFLDDDTAVTWAATGGVWVWSLDAPGEPLAHDGALTALTVVTDGQAIYARTAGQVHRLDRALKPLAAPWTIPDERSRQPYEERRPLALLPGGRLLVPTEDAVVVLDAATLADVTGQEPPFEAPSSDARLCCAASDGRWVVVGEGTPGLSRGDLQQHLATARADERLDGLSRDEIARLSELPGRGSVLRWPAAGGTVESRVEVHTRVLDVALGPGDPPTVAFGLYSGFVRQWSSDGSLRWLTPDDSDPPGPVAAHPRLGHVHAVTFLPDGRLLTLAGGYAEGDTQNEARTWSARGEPLDACDLLRAPRSVSLSPGGRLLLVGIYASPDEEAATRPASWAEVWTVSGLDRALRAAKERRR